MDPYLPDTSFAQYEGEPGGPQGPEEEREFCCPPDRERVTREPDQAGTHPVPDHADQDWISYRNQGGGYVPGDYAWRSNPKEEHDLESCG